MNHFNIVIAAKHPITMLGIKQVVQEIEDIHIVGEFKKPIQLIENISKLNTQLIIIEFLSSSNEQNDALTLVNFIKRQFPAMPILALLPHNNYNLLQSIAEQDIECLIHSHDSADTLKQAIACARQNIPFKSTSIQMVLKESHNILYCYKHLSAKKSEVIHLFATGMQLTEIAHKLNRSIKTISSQKKSAMQALGVKNDIELMNYLHSTSPITFSNID